MKRIIDNLIVNALMHSEGDLNIKIENKDDLTIEFSNKLANKDIDLTHIFDESYTEDISRTKGNMGLGLAIAKNFTGVLNGKISVSVKENDLVITLRFLK